MSPSRCAVSASSTVPARDDRPLPSATTSTVLNDALLVTFKVNLLDGWIVASQPQSCPPRRTIQPPRTTTPRATTDESGLKPQPIVVHVPSTPGRFNVVPLMTPYTENFANIGEGASGMLAPGNYVIAGPKKYAGVEEVDGMKVIHSPYERAWIIQRTLVKSHEDLPNAVAIQAETKLVPLNRWKKEGLNYQPPAPEKEVTTPTEYKVPGTQAGEEPLTYWNALGAALKQFKPPAADQPELELLKTVGIGPGKFPVNNAKLSAGTIAGLRAAVAAGPGQVTKELTEMFHAGFTAHNGWLVAAGRHLRHQLLAEGDSRQDRTRRAAAEHRDLPDRADRTRRPSAQRREHALRGTLSGE